VIKFRSKAKTLPPQNTQIGKALEGEAMPLHSNTARFVLKSGERTVTRDQILQAMEEFDEEKRGKVADTQRGWLVRENEQRYPPKWLLKLATGDLLLGEFKSSEARKTLNDLGFDLREVDEVDEVDDPNEVNGQAEAIKFGLERDLQNALRNNMEQLEPGLKICDGGKEQMVESGRIDITAEDRNGTTVVIELKAGKAGRRAIGQILAYMGDFVQGKKTIRGILVAEEFSPQAMSAARVVPDLQLRKYSFKFAFETVGAG
jgi:hypothetical protein